MKEEADKSKFSEGMSDEKLDNPKKKPEPRRSGQVTERGKDRYLIRIFIGKDATGKRHWHNETFYGKRKQAETRVRELLQKVKTGEPLKMDNSQFGAFLDEWLRSHPDIKESSVENYRTMVDTHVRPKLGGLMLARIVADNIQTLYDDLREAKLSPATVGYVHTLLRSIFKLAVLRRRINVNPMDGVKSPRGKRLQQEQREKRESKVMEPEEVAAFLRAAESTRFGALFTLAFSTGARPGELLALTWGDLDAGARTIHIRRNIKFKKGGGWYLDTPKSDAGRRTLKIGPEVAERLSLHSARQEAEKNRAGKAYSDHGFIFCDEVGAPYSQNRLRYYCKVILKAAGLPAHHSPYDARHTSATRMIEGGINAKVAAGRLGHSDPTITIRHYVHSTEGMDDQATEVLSRLVKGEK